MATPHRIDLPGLVGDEPLGFLAAITLLGGVICSGHMLSWDPNDHHAILHCGRCSSVADVVAALVRHLGAVEDGQAIPYTRGFPVRRRRGGPDPLRVRPAEYDRLLDRVSRSPGGRHWLTATVTNQAMDADGFCAVNPLVAVRGRQTIGSFWYYPMLEVRQDPERLLTEALTGWRRVEGSEGWLLDHHATYSTDPDLRGPGGSMAVPGATWLATLAVAKFGYFSHTAIGPGRAASGWFQIDGRSVFLWPLWTLPASNNTLDAVWNVGWRSKEWDLTSARDGTLQAHISKTHGVPAPNSIGHNVDLDIFAMCAAVRSTRSPLTPIPVRTGRKQSDWVDYPAWKGWGWKAPEIHDYADGPGWA